MKLNELIQALNKEKEIAGGDVNVRLSPEREFDDNYHIEDVVLTGTKSLIGSAMEDETILYLTY